MTAPEKYTLPRVLEIVRGHAEALRAVWCGPRSIGGQGRGDPRPCGWSMHSRRQRIYSRSRT